MKIALVGDAIATREDAPFDDPSWEIWGLSCGFWHLPRADRYFELHDLALVRKEVNLDAFLSSMPRLGVKEVFVHPEVAPYAPHAKPFPFQQVKVWAKRPYFTASLAWLVAYAMMAYGTELREIGVFGHEMTRVTGEHQEYVLQKSCCEYWLGRAEQSGIKITVASGSTLLKGSALYGLETAFNDRVNEIFDLRTLTLRKERESCVATLEVLGRVYSELEGRLDEMKHPQSTKRRKVVESDLEKVRADSVNIKALIQEYNARLDEAETYRVNHTIPDDHKTIRLAEVEVAV